MDLLLGIKTQNEVILVTSRNFTRGISIMNHKDRKFTNLSDNIVMGISGESGDTSQFAEYIKANIQLYENRYSSIPTISLKKNEEESEQKKSKSHLTTLSTKNVANFVRQELAKSLRSRKPYQVNLIIAGGDGSLYMIDYLGTMVEQPYVVQGYAGFYALALLDHHYRVNLTEEEGIELVKKCIKEVNLRMPASIGDVDIVVLSADKESKEMLLTDKELLLLIYKKYKYKIISSETIIKTNNNYDIPQALDFLMSNNYRGRGNSHSFYNKSRDNSYNGNFNGNKQNSGYSRGGFANRNDYVNDPSLSLEDKVIQLLNLTTNDRKLNENKIIVEYILKTFDFVLKKSNFDKETTLSGFNNKELQLDSTTLPFWKLQKLGILLYKDYESNNNVKLERLKAILQQNQSLMKRIGEENKEKLEKISKFMIANYIKNVDKFDSWVESLGLRESINEIQKVLEDDISNKKRSRKEGEEGDEEEVIVVRNTKNNTPKPSFLNFSHLKNLKGENISNNDNDLEEERYFPKLPSFSRDNGGVFTKNSARKSDLLLNDTDKAIEYKYLDENLLRGLQQRIKVKNKVTSHDAFADKTMIEVQESLPIFKFKKQIIDLVSANQISIIIGETGSGKTTQLCQYLHENFPANKMIITQPRRVAAISVSKRVGEEQNDNKNLVGYKVRFEESLTKNTKILFMTDGILIREFLNDPLLTKYDFVIIDEAHERSLNCDIILGILKKICEIRIDLKVVIMSATLDSDMFSKFFSGCPVMKIPGKTFPVEVNYLESPTYDYLNLTIDKAVDIHLNESLDGDVLIFLTGAEEIEKCVEMITQKLDDLKDFLDENDPKRELFVLPIYSSMSQHLQDKIFLETECRKIIVSTNIAETSLTIPNIKYVVDCGYTKINVYNPFLKIDQLKVVPVSKQQADQRLGRAGRVKPGKCFRLFTEKTYDNELLSSSVPEIQRVNLCNVVLQLKMILNKFKALNVDIDQSVIKFPFIEPPSLIQFRNALEQLFYLNAIEDDGKEGSLSVLGEKMVQFPLDPYLSKTVLESVNLNCSKQVLIIISFLNLGNSLFEMIKTDKEKANFNKIFNKFFKDPDYNSDLLNYLKIYDQMEKSKAQGFTRWCESCYINTKNMMKMLDILNQLIQIMESLGQKIISNELHKENIIKAFIKSFKVNIVVKKDANIYENMYNIERNKQKKKDNDKEESEIFIHPTSSLFRESIKNGSYLMYTSLIMTKKNYMNCLSLLKPEWLLDESEFKQDKEAYKKIKLERINDRTR
ncbi:hypothetical protein QEN19_004146 [Hanseniaspora menglaensis]